MSTFLYNPDRKPKKELISEFVVRTDIFEEIMTDLETSKMKHPEQHYLLVGQRGAGKTTLLNRLKYAIEDSPKLKDKVIPILFSEEQYNISELVNLWENVAQHLEDYHDFEGLYHQMEANEEKKNFEELSFDLLQSALKKKKKNLVLLIDNIGDLLKKLDKTEVHRLRGLMQTHSEIRLIVGSPFYLETILDYQQPLFEFFKVMQLDGLTKGEAEALLKKLAETHGEKEKINKIITETPERVETLRKLTGGVPRTISFMYNVFVEYNNEDTVKDLEKILDAVTPLYKHRMDDLPTQQQKIVDAVAKNWDGVSVKELTTKLRLESKTISAQLRQLEKNQIIEIVQTGKKNHLYMLKERFFNIWYLMRYGRKYDQQRVIWLVKFLESWCSIAEIEQRILDYINKIKSGNKDDHFVAFYGQLYIALGKNMRAEMKLMLKENTPSYISKQIELEDYELLKIAYENIDQGNNLKAFEMLTQLKSIDEENSMKLAIWLLNLIGRNPIEFNKVVTKHIEDYTKEAPDTYLSRLMFLSIGCYVSIFRLVNLQYEEAHKTFKEFFDIIAINRIIHQSTITLLTTSLIFTYLYSGQANVVMDVFTEHSELKDWVKPLYYTALVLFEGEGRLSTIAPELQAEVQALLKSIAHFKERLNAIDNANRSAVTNK